MAQGLGQSENANQGLGAQTALRNMQNAQAASKQRLAGQSELLKNQGMLNAQGQLGDLYGAMGQQDLTQAQAQQGARAGVTEANNALNAGGKGILGGLASGLGQGLALFGLSSGGRVPGRAVFGGDDPRNDRIPALLSSGELVVPRSFASDPDKAAAYAHALATKKLERHAAGGPAGDNGISLVGTNFMPGPQYTQANSVQSGGDIDTGALQGVRGQVGQLGEALGNTAFGTGGPSLAPQQLQNATDASVAQAMQTQGAGVRPAALANEIGGAASGLQGQAGAIGEQQARQQQAAQQQLGALLAQARDREINTAKARQQAQWAATMSNAGVDLQNQAMMRNILGGAGAAGAALLNRKSSPSSPDTNQSSGDNVSENNNTSGFAFGGIPGYAFGTASAGDAPGYDYVSPPTSAPDAGTSSPDAGVPTPSWPVGGQSPWSGAGTSTPVDVAQAKKNLIGPEIKFSSDRSKAEADKAKEEQKLAQPSGGIGQAPTSGLGDIIAGTRGEQEAITNEGNIRAQQARFEARAEADKGLMLKQHAEELDRTRHAASADAGKRMAAFEAATSDFGKIDTKIDPGRFWASKSTGDKILGAISLALGAVGAGNTGVNSAVGVIENAINRDIDAQKTQLSARLEQGKVRMEGSRSLMEMNHQIFGDDIANQTASHAMGLQLADNKLKEIASRAGDPIAKAQAAQLSAALQMKLGEKKNELGQQALNNAARSQMLELQKIRAGASMNQQGLADEAARKDVEDWAKSRLARPVAQYGKEVSGAQVSLADDILNARGERVNPENRKKVIKDELSGAIDWERFHFDPQGYGKRRSDQILEEIRRSRHSNPRTAKTSQFEDMGGGAE